MVAGSIAREKLALGLTDVPTSEALLAGTVRVTCGATACAVVKDHVTEPASAMPSVARAPVPTVAVYVVPNARAADGVRTAVWVPLL